MLGQPPLTPPLESYTQPLGIIWSLQRTEFGSLPLDLCTVPSPPYHPPPPLILLPNFYSSFTSQMPFKEPSLAPDSAFKSPCATSITPSVLCAEISCSQNHVCLGAQASQAGPVSWSPFSIGPCLPTQAPQVPPGHAVHFHVWCPCAFHRQIPSWLPFSSAIPDSFVSKDPTMSTCLL